MGNPSSATSDLSTPNNYLMAKPQYVLSYNNSLGTPNWVSWHLNSSWLGTTPRSNDFRPDPALPSGWLQVTPADYEETGFDKGHMCNAEDRSRDAVSDAGTFLMDNMVPQSPKNNEHTWEGLEAYCRTLAKQGDELYIVSGPAGRGGEGSKGKMTTIASKSDPAHRQIAVPASVWKVVLVLPKGQTTAQGVAAGAKAIAVIMPNNQELSLNWQDYIVSVNDVENLTGLKFFSNVAPAVAAGLKAQRYKAD